MKWIKDGERIPIKSWCENIEQGAMRQAEDLAALSVTFSHVALMPDCHVGYGMPIGGVIACENAIIPNAVGVDIGCGMVAARTDLPAADLARQNIEKIVNDVQRCVPVGFEHHDKPQKWDRFKTAPVECPPVAKEIESARKQLGTLGGGNHFMEIQKGDDGFIWLMVHSGSRNFGLKIAEYYHKVARRLCERAGTPLPAIDLAWLPADSQEGQEYFHAMSFALDFAKKNRELMMEKFAEIFCKRMESNVVRTINIHHNYAALETHFQKKVMVHRKGATSARKDELGIIPGSMGTPSYIVRGLGNPESFNSCSHGAGRCMGRNDANRKLSVDACDKAMEGIVHGRWSRGRGGAPDLSEAPQAYKNIDEVIAAQSDLVQVVTKLLPLGVVKG